MSQEAALTILEDGLRSFEGLKRTLCSREEGEIARRTTSSACQAALRRSKN